MNSLHSLHAACPFASVRIIPTATHINVQVQYPVGGGAWTSRSLNVGWDECDTLCEVIERLSGEVVDLIAERSK